MCGFFFSNRSIDHDNKDSLNRIKSLLYHRGPDNQAIYQDNVGTFVFSRLSIIDLDDRASQPMRDIDGRYLIMNNGEIYNYLELKEELSQEYSFTTKSDTEVFLNLWRKEKELSISHLRGMYAFLILDRKRGIIYFGRDPLGIKPLYFSFKNSNLVISSETCVFRELGFNSLDKSVLPELVTFGSPGDERTGLKDVERCIPGCIYSYELGTSILSKIPHKSLNKDQYSFFTNLPKSLNEKEIVDLVEEELCKSIELHLRSDVGYSIQLSGGVDSSLITALASKITQKKQKTFGLEILGSHQDEAWARKLVVDKYQCEHTEVTISSETFANYFERTIKALDSPIVHSGSPAIMRLYEIMRRNSPVAITGEGADEAFMGYSRYREADRLKKIGLFAKIIPEFIIPYTRYKAAKSYTRSRDPICFSSVYSDTTNLINTFPDLFKGDRFLNPRIISKYGCIQDKINSYDIRYYLQTLLHRQDMLSMQSSVECRTPFADQAIFSLSKLIPLNYKVTKSETKKILKTIALKYLPRSIIYRKKIGLTIPLDDWLKTEEIFLDKLSQLKGTNSKLAQYSNRKVLSKYVSDFMNGDLSLRQFDIFRLLCIEEWLGLFN